MPVPAVEPAFRIERALGQGGGAAIRLSGRLAFADAGAIRSALREAAAAPAPRFVLDLQATESIDGGITALVVALRRELRARGAEVEIAAPEGGVGALVDLFIERADGECLHEPPKNVGILDEVGKRTEDLAGFAKELLGYVGEIAVAAGEIARRPASANWRDVGRLAERAGADGFPIVAMISLLLGLILGFQAALQLKQFGANIYAADLVGLSVTRELGPIMVAIIVAGRSGAAFAAELGTMKVSEEIDALRTLGLSPYRFLVFPRVLALVIVVPILTLLGDAIALFGGLVVGITGLDLTVHGYVTETQNVVDLWDVGQGLVKSVFFGLAIGLISCERGLTTSGGADGVGRSTTSSVVTILFHIIVIDFFFTVLFLVLEW